jgi:hypothetical protein
MEAFTEEQRFIRYWWFISLPAMIPLMFAIVNRDEANASSGIIAISGVAVVMLLLTTLKLSTRVDQHGISFSYFPLVRNTRIMWAEVLRASVHKTNPLFEYGGWGVRMFWRKKAYNVWGTKGLVIELKNGKHVMIGTNQPERLTDYLVYLKQKYGVEAL